MKNSKWSTYLIVSFLFILISNHNAFAQAPPPPGVPLDFGLSVVAAICVGYGAYKNKN